MKSLSRVRLFATPWTVAYQALPSMGFPRQEYWSRLPFPAPGDLSNPGIEPGSPALQSAALPSEPPRKRFPAFLVVGGLQDERKLFANHTSGKEPVSGICKEWPQLSSKKTNSPI